MGVVSQAILWAGDAFAVESFEVAGHEEPLDMPDNATGPNDSLNDRPDIGTVRRKSDWPNRKLHIRTRLKMQLSSG